MSMTVKAYLKRGENANAEIRRFVIDEAVTSNYEYLSEKVAQVFPGLGDNFSLSWKDAEGDQITFSSDEELMEGLGQITEDIFRIYVKEKRNKGRRECFGQTSTDCPSPSKGAEEEAYHPGVVCDGCENRIRGPRFKCVTCPDYDLCKQCEARGLHPEHSFIKFRKPQIGRSHHGGFFNRPGMFRQFGHPGWRRWWSWNQQQQQQSQNQGQEQGQGGEAGTSTQQESFQGAGASTGPQGNGGCPMGSGPFQPPPPPHEFLRDIGQTVAQMLDPLGIDVDIDIDHNGQQTHCAGESRACRGRGKHGHGRRHGGKGHRGCRNSWAGNEQSTMDDDRQEPAPSSGAKLNEENGEGGSAQTKEEGATQKQAEGSGKDKASAEQMEMGETSSGGVRPNGGGTSGANGANGTDDADWTMLDEGQGKATPPSQQNTGEAFQYQTALIQMQAMGFDNDGGWLTSLLEAKGGDIVRVLDAIKIGNQPTFTVNMK